MKCWIFTGFVLAVLCCGCSTAKEKAAIELNKGGEALDKKKYDEAMEHYLNAIDHNPYEWRAYAECGDISVTLGKFENAITYYENASGILDSMITQYKERGRQKNYYAPAVMGDIKYRYTPMLADLLHKRGIALTFLDRHKEAMVSYKQCLDKLPTHLHAWLSLALLADEKMKDPEVALYCYTEFLKWTQRADNYDRQAYRISDEKITHARKRRYDLQPEPAISSTAEKKPSVSRHELLCITDDVDLRKEIMEMLVAETEKLDLKVELEKSTIRIYGKKEQLEPLKKAILDGFPKRLDRLELEIKEAS